MQETPSCPSFPAPLKVRPKCNLCWCACHSAISTRPRSSPPLAHTSAACLRRLTYVSRSTFSTATSRPPPKARPPTSRRRAFARRWQLRRAFPSPPSVPASCAPRLRPRRSVSGSLLRTAPCACTECAVRAPEHRAAASGGTAGTALARPCTTPAPRALSGRGRWQPWPGPFSAYWPRCGGMNVPLSPFKALVHTHEVCVITSG
mmetsp:Transcript_429/g.1115  ORF Transcript_429/g.1115 Transcript_429/m.1115 type:complete len:204 (-) Transcript_429:259-870(-)